jgi:hypothetical protein
MIDETLMARRRQAELLVKIRNTLEHEFHRVLVDELDGKPGGLDEVSAKLSVAYRRIWDDVSELEAACGLSQAEMNEAYHRVDPMEHYPGIDDDANFWPDDPDDD